MGASRLVLMSATFTAALLSDGCGKAAAPAPPLDVVVAEVAQQDVPVYGEWIGTLDGFVNAEIRAQVSGYLQRQAYREGSHVRKGDLLFEIDPRPFQAALDQALAQLGKTELDVKRLTPLAKEEAVSRQELDDAIQANLANKAAVEAARLNLDFTHITSPIDGLAGIAAADVGDLVGPSSGRLATVSTVDPIKVYFPISEKEYLNARALFTGDAEPGGTGLALEPELILADGSHYPHKGELYATARHVEVTTGTIRLAALVSNPGEVLRPGQYARVRAVTQIRKGALLVPQRAVTELQGSDQVAVVGSGNKVSIRTVTVGERVGATWIVETGLKPGERVIVEGIQKAREGAVVNPRSK